MNNLQNLAIGMVRHVEAMDEQIVALSGFHAEHHVSAPQIGSDCGYYLAHGTMWRNGSYAVRGGQLYRNIAGEVRRLIAESLEIAARLAAILEAVSIQAGRNESAAATLIAG